MAQYYTLDEAATKLGLKTDEFRKKLATQWKTLRRFPDGATLRFQARDIDELARQTGRSSDPDLQLGDAPIGLADAPEPGVGAKKKEETIFVPPPSDDEFIPLAVDDPSVSGRAPKPGSDSDVKLEKTSGGSVKPVTSKDDATELLDIADGPKSKSTFEVKSDASKKSARQQVTSEYELKLNTDSDEFNLELADDSDEVPLGKSARRGAKSGDSGINLQDPADSGISLEDESSSEFELQLDEGPKSKPKVADAKKAADDSDSEFELTLDEGSGEVATAFDAQAAEQKDIFETDFELPAIDDSGSEEKASSSTELEESDFDLSVDDESEVSEDEESASEVVAIEEESSDDDLDVVDADEVEPSARPMRAVESAPANWGTLPIAGLIPTVFIMFFVGLMGYELLHSMWNYHKPGAGTGPIVRTVAGWFGKLDE